MTDRDQGSRDRVNIIDWAKISPDKLLFEEKGGDNTGIWGAATLPHDIGNISANGQNTVVTPAEWDAVVEKDTNQEPWVVYEPQDPTIGIGLRYIEMFISAFNLPESAADNDDTKRYLSGKRTSRGLVARIIRRATNLNKPKSMGYGHRPNMGSLTHAQNVMLFGNAGDETGPDTEELTTKPGPVFNNILGPIVWPEDRDITEKALTHQEPIECWEIYPFRVIYPSTSIEQRLLGGLSRTSKRLKEVLSTRAARAVGLGVLAISATFFNAISSDPSISSNLSNQATYVHPQQPVDTNILMAEGTQIRVNETPLNFLRGDLGITGRGVHSDHGGEHPFITGTPLNTNSDISSTADTSAQTTEQQTELVLELEHGDTVWGKVGDALNAVGIDDDGEVASIVNAMRALNPDRNLDLVPTGKQSFGIPTNLINQALQNSKAA
jgi:hypothetical protein